MHPMLTDFGIARLADSPGLTRTHEFVGTPAYVAPESAEGRPQTSAVDIYGAGILLYELVTGRPPFAGGTALEVLHQHLSEEPRRPSTVPDPLWTVIERCLRKNPDERPSAENLARAPARRRLGHRGARAPAQIAAAEGVGALLAPDPAPAAVPGDPGRGRRRHRCCRSNAGCATTRTAATSVLPHTGQGGRAADPTARAAARAAGPAAAAVRRRPEDPHPWQSQLQRGPRPQRTDAGPVPRPERGPAAPPPPAPGRPPASSPAAAVRSSGQQPQPVRLSAAASSRSSTHRSTSSRSSYAPPQPQQQPQPQRYAPPQQPAPQQPAPRQPREPRQRSANPMKIPGLGCLKGCLFTIVMLFVAGWLIWELSPLQDWIGTTARASGTPAGPVVSTTSPDWIGDLGLEATSGRRGQLIRCTLGAADFCGFVDICG